MMGQKTVEPELYINFSLDAAVPPGHLVRQLGSCVDFDFIRPLVKPLYSHTGQPSVDPVVLFKLALLGVQRERRERSPSRSSRPRVALARLCQYQCGTADVPRARREYAEARSVEPHHITQEVRIFQESTDRVVG